MTKTEDEEADRRNQGQKVVAAAGEPRADGSDSENIIKDVLSKIALMPKIKDMPRPKRAPKKMRTFTKK